MLKSGQMYDDSLDAADTLKREASKLDSARKLVERHPDIASAEKRSENSDQDKIQSAAILRLNSGALPFASQPASVTGSVKQNSDPPQPRKRGRPRKTPPAQVSEGGNLT